MGTKTTVVDLLEGIELREKELRESIVKLTAGKTGVKKSTSNTMRFHLNRDLKVLGLVKSLIKATNKTEIVLEESDLKGFNSICYPSSGVNKVEVKEGDLILNLMEQYAEVKDLGNKLAKAALKIGCRLNFKTGKVEKL